ncbi:MAG: hypothetical protein H0T43_12125, partial [Solirubrobacterales bacterium]|nr:hypothetical protein [Solirubrobacterales bacterium]
ARLRVAAIPLPAPRAGEPRQQTMLVEVSTPTRAAKARLQALGLDLTEHGDARSLDVVLHGVADEARLRAAGFAYEIEIPDMLARQAENRLRDARYALRVKRSSLPSRRDDYRRLPDFEADMKALAERRPDLVKPIVLPHRTLEGRPVQGIEITKDADRADGKPVYLQLGVHHAREWPSGEMPMEFAFELVNGYGSSERITGLVDRVRTIVVPVVNPDGYNLSREAPVDLRGLGTTAPLTRAIFDVIGATGLYEVLGPDTSGLVNQAGGNPGGIAAILLDAQSGNFAYKRRNCRITDGQAPAPGECAMSDNRELGTDPNRNYAGFWGGPGASVSPTADDYRGTAPFSEPETQNIRELVSSRQVTTLITNHTYSDLVLRPPGVAAEGTTPDEPIYKALGDAMGQATAYNSQYGHELYDTTGTTEDWSYFQTGGLGYTFEIGPHEFHPPYEQVINEYEGRAPTPVDAIGRPQKQGGNREAYLLAMESTADTERHSVLTGRGSPGARLEISRSAMHLTSPVIAEDGRTGDPLTLSETAGSALTVPADGTFSWHVNPSTRPYAQKDRSTILPADAPASREEISGAPVPPVNLIPVQVGPGDPPFLKASIAGAGASDDYDLYLYRGSLPVPSEEVASSATPSNSEQFTVKDLPPGRYTLEVRNFSATGSWSGAVERYANGRTVGLPPATEAWKLTCTSAAGDVLGTRTVTVARGQRQDLGAVCSESAGAFSAALERRRLRAALRRGNLRGRVRCATACRVSTTLSVDARTARRLGLTRARRAVVVARGSRRTFTGRRTYSLRFTKAARRRLRAARTVRLRMVATARSGATRQTVRRTYVLRR